MNITHASCLHAPKPLIKLPRKHPPFKLRNMCRHEAEAQQAFVNGCRLAYPIMISTLMYLHNKNIIIKVMNEYDSYVQMEDVWTIF